MAERGDALADLVNFVASAFARHELEGFIRRLPDGSQLIFELPSAPASPVQVADALVLGLQRHGLLDRDFFLALIRERRSRRDEIELLMLNYLPGPKPRIQLGEGTELCNGRFVLTDLRDSGGFGALWKARDTLLKENVAIKVLSRELSEKEYAWRRTMFMRGAQRMAAIKHAHIARVLIPHVREKGYDFCVLEYIDGRSLYAEVRAKSFGSIHEIVMALLDIGAGLADIHAAGSIHGDVSPKNILVKRINGRAHARLVDFDLVCASDDRLLTMAATGMPGTDPYAAPEWKAREGKLDGRVDVFGLGMTAVYAFYGSALPPSLNDPDAMVPAHFIARKLHCDPAIKLVLTQACSHERDGRYATMLDLCIALKRAVTRGARSNQSLAGGSDSQAPPVPRGPSVLPFPADPPVSPGPAPAAPSGGKTALTEPLQQSLRANPGRRGLVALVSVLIISLTAASYWLVGIGRREISLNLEADSIPLAMTTGLDHSMRIELTSTSGETSDANPIEASQGTSTTTVSTEISSSGHTSADSSSGSMSSKGLVHAEPRLMSKSAFETLFRQKLARCGSTLMAEVVKVEVFISSSGKISSISILDEELSVPVGVFECVKGTLDAMKVDRYRFGRSGRIVLDITLPVVDSPR